MTALDMTFKGCSERHGGMTWAQQDIGGFIYGGAGQSGDYHARNSRPDLYNVVDPGPNVSPEVCLEVLQALVRRHEALRTTFARGLDGFSGQQVHSDGTISLQISPTGGTAPDQAASLMTERLASSVIDVTTELPLRVGLVTDADAVCRIVLGVSRMVADGWGIANLVKEVRRALTERDLLREPRTPGFHQLDQWAWEQSATGQKRAEAALDYRRRSLMQGDGSYAGLVSVRPIRRMRLGRRFFEAGLTTARENARGMSASFSALLLSSCARAVSRVLGADALTVLVHCANRFDAPRESSVTRLKGMALMRYEATSSDVEQDVKQVSWALVAAYRHAQFPPDASAALTRRSEQQLLLEFNDRCPIVKHAAGVRTGTAQSVPSASDVTLADGGRGSGSPHIGFAIDPKGDGGLKIKLESNVLTDDEIVATLNSVGEAACASAELR